MLVILKVAIPDMFKHLAWIWWINRIFLNFFPTIL